MAWSSRGSSHLRGEFGCNCCSLLSIDYDFFFVSVRSRGPSAASDFRPPLQSPCLGVHFPCQARRLWSIVCLLWGPVVPLAVTSFLAEVLGCSSRIKTFVNNYCRCCLLVGSTDVGVGVQIGSIRVTTSWSEPMSIHGGCCSDVHLELRSSRADLLTRET